MSPDFFTTQEVALLIQKDIVKTTEGILGAQTSLTIFVSFGPLKVTKTSKHTKRNIAVFLFTFDVVCKDLDELCPFCTMFRERDSQMLLIFL